MNRWIHAFLSVVLPWACAGCRKVLGTLDDIGFCPDCHLRLPYLQGCVCLCGIPLPSGGASCHVCRRTPLPMTIRAAFRYEGGIRTALHRFKYLGRPSLSEPLAAMMDSAWKTVEPTWRADFLVPVPLHANSFRERHYNQAELLALGLSKRWGIPTVHALNRLRSTRPQFQLSRDEREHNVHQAFGLAVPSVWLKKRRILLIDDVATTAATLKECRHVLRRNGASEVKAFVLARDLVSPSR